MDLSLVTEKHDFLWKLGCFLIKLAQFAFFLFTGLGEQTLMGFFVTLSVFSKPILSVESPPNFLEKQYSSYPDCPSLKYIMYIYKRVVLYFFSIEKVRHH